MERQEQWQGAEDLVEGGLLCPVILSAKPLVFDNSLISSSNPRESRFVQKTSQGLSGGSGL